MPLIVYASPIITVLVITITVLICKKLTSGTLSLKKFTLFYWLGFATLEICVIIYVVKIMSTPQYIPPSLYINFIWGSYAFVYYFVISLFTKYSISQKTKYLFSVAIFNYIVLGFGLACIFPY